MTESRGKPVADARARTLPGASPNLKFPVITATNTV